MEKWSRAWYHTETVDSKAHVVLVLMYVFPAIPEQQVVG